MRRIHEGTDSLEEQLAAVTDQQETKPSNESATKENTPEVVAEKRGSRRRRHGFIRGHRKQGCQRYVNFVVSKRSTRRR